MKVSETRLTLLSTHELDVVVARARRERAEVIADLIARAMHALHRAWLRLTRRPAAVRQC